jgi:hypothetical protein
MSTIAVYLFESIRLLTPLCNYNIAHYGIDYNRQNAQRSSEKFDKSAILTKNWPRRPGRGESKKTGQDFSCPG